MIFFWVEGLEALDPDILIGLGFFLLVLNDYRSAGRSMCVMNFLVAASACQKLVILGFYALLSLIATTKASFLERTQKKKILDVFFVCVSLAEALNLLLSPLYAQTISLKSHIMLLMQTQFTGISRLTD